MLEWIKSLFIKPIKPTGRVFRPLVWQLPTNMIAGSSFWGWGGFPKKLNRGDSIILNMQSGKKARFLVLSVKNAETPSGLDHFGEVYQDVKVQPIEYV